MVDERVCMEISPGTIASLECEHCSNEAFTFDAVALNNNGVSWVGTITRCTECETP